MNVKIIQRCTLVMITLVVLAVIFAVQSESGINCNNPATWSTKQGVQHCAINGGK